MRRFRSRVFAFFETGKSTSGQRFYGALATKINACLETDSSTAPLILFNVSAPLFELLECRFRGQGIFVRVDGVYFDRLSVGFLSSLRTPLRLLFGLAPKRGVLNRFACDIANLINENYGAFARILLADGLIYQSEYSRRMHARYFCWKPAITICNGANFVADGSPAASSSIELVTIYDDWRPTKRIPELVEFVHWARRVKDMEINLTILGYNGRLPRCTDSTLRTKIEACAYIRTLSRFREFGDEHKQALRQADMYITFTYRDACPNAVIEAMARGLPVVAAASGGIPDIVKDAGVLVKCDDGTEYFTAARFENVFPCIDYHEVLAAIKKVKGQNAYFRKCVRDRFSKDLNLDIVATRYMSALLGWGGDETVI